LGKIAAISFLAFLLFLFFVPNSVTAGDSFISGTIQDEINFEPLENVMVTVKYSSNESEVGFTESDSSGHYQISDLPAGTFNVTFELPGYKEKYEIIMLEDNETRTLDVLLDDFIYDTDGDGIPDSDREPAGDGDIALGEASETCPAKTHIRPYHGKSRKTLPGHSI
jgi:hypothetical protein